MDNHLVRSGVKRSRFDDNVTPSTSSMSMFPPTVDAVCHFCNNDGKSKENEALHQQYLELQSKNVELEAGFTKLQQAYQYLLVLYNSQTEHISKLPNQSEVTALKQTIEIMTAEYLKKISEVEKQRDDYKDVIKGYEKKEANRQALENEVKSLKDRFNQQLEDVKNNYEQESARLHKNYVEMNAKEKNCDRMVSCQGNVALEANNIDLQNTQDINRNVRHEENMTLLYLRDQKLSWFDYEKLVSSETIKNIQLVRVHIEKGGGISASLVDILRKLPNLEMFECVLDGKKFITYKRKYFTTLVNRAPFKNLQKFSLSGIPSDAFDVDQFLAFMKKHPTCHFSISFKPSSSLKTAQDRFKAMVKKLRDAHPSDDKLVILSNNCF